MTEKHFCCFCRHHTSKSNEKDIKKRMVNALKPYSDVCGCSLNRKEHNYFPTWGNDCCMINPVECEYFEQK